MTFPPGTIVVSEPAHDYSHALVSIMRAIAELSHHVTEGFRDMSQTADQTAATVNALDSKVDALIAAIAPGVQLLRDQLAAAQQQVAALIAGETADATTLQAAIVAAQGEVTKVDAAIAALTPPVTPPAA